MNPIREKMIAALIQHAKGQIAKHKINVEVYLNNPVGIGEHPDVMEAIERELGQMAHYHDQLEVIGTYIQ